MKKILVLLCLLIICLLIFFCIPKERESDIQFAISFCPSGIPVTEVTIGETNFPFIIDLGASSYMGLRKNKLDKIEKVLDCVRTIIDIKGNKYKESVYVVPEVKIGEIKCKNVPINEISDEFYDEGSVLSTEPLPNVKTDTIGSIGRKVFMDDKQIFLDFSHSLMSMCNSIKMKKKKGYKIEHMVQVPFDLHPGICVKFETEAGAKKFLLDTGAEVSVIKPSSVFDQPEESLLSGCSGKKYTCSQLKIGKEDFGPQEFYLFEIDSAFSNIDGFLGMDFFRRHVLHIDFKTQTLHIGKTEKCCPKDQNSKASVPQSD